MKNIFSWQLLQNALNFYLKLILGDLDENWACTDKLSTEIAKNKLNWAPRYNLQDVVNDMMQSDLKLMQDKKNLKRFK